MEDLIIRIWTGKEICTDLSFLVLPRTIFLLNFWIKDTSKGFEATDAAIEKSVTLGFKLMGENMLDQVFDFGKFMFQNMREKMA